MRTQLGLRATTVFGCLLILLAGVSGISAMHRLAQRAELLWTQSLPSAWPPNVLRRHLERMDQAVLPVLAGRRDLDAEQLEEADAAFEEVLEGLRNSSTATGSGELLARVSEEWGALRWAARSAARRAPTAGPEQRLALVDEYSSASIALQKTLRELAHRSELTHAQGARMLWTQARGWSAWIAFAIAGAVAMVLLQYQYVDTRLLQALEGLRQLLDRVALGDALLRIPAQPEANLNRLANSCNRLIDRLEHLAEEEHQVVRTEALVASALIECHAEPVFMMDVAGQLLLANEAARKMIQGDEGLAFLQALREVVPAGSGRVHLRNAAYDVTVEDVPRSRFPGVILRLTAVQSETST